MENLYRLDSDPEVMRYISGGKPTPYEEIVNETLPGIFEIYERSADLGLFAAIERSSKDFIGWFEFYSPKDRASDEIELGYRLVRPAWGKGYATEGSLALIKLGFKELGVRRIFAHTMTVNTASRRVMEKCGLKFVRTFFAEWPYRIEGSEHGDVEYALTREEWLRGRM